jgi:hypothetical protein
MRKKIGSALIVVSVVSFAFLSAGPSAPEGVKGRILAATNSLAGPPDPAFNQEKLLTSLFELMDIAAALSVDTPREKDIRFRIDVAKDLIKRDSLFNEKARQYLRLAYRMMTNGKKFESPKHLDEFVTAAEAREKVVVYFKGLVEEAVKSLDAGDKGRSAAFLLEMVLLTITPVQG